MRHSEGNSTLLHLQFSSDGLFDPHSYHWAVENSLHWVLDVIFREDDSRIRTGDAAQNMALLRKFALNILKNDPSKGSIRTKRFKAGLDTTFLEQLLDHV